MFKLLENSLSFCFSRKDFAFQMKHYLLFHDKSTNNISIKKKKLIFFSSISYFYLKMTAIYLEKQ